MTYSLQIEKTTSLVVSLAMMKQKEISLYKEKMEKLKDVFMQNQNDSVNAFRYNLAKTRYEQLVRTTKGLRRLEHKIETFKY